MNIPCNLMRIFALSLTLLFHVMVAANLHLPTGSLIGVYVKMNKKSGGQECEIKSVVMSALMSYFLQLEMKAMDYERASLDFQSQVGNQQSQLSNLSSLMVSIE